jgi:hypothetical protein
MTGSAPHKILLVVDGNFSLGAQSKDDERFTVSWLKNVLQSVPGYTIDTANRNGDPDATKSPRFTFTKSVALSDYNQIWMMGTASDEDLSAPPLDDDELIAIAQFMKNGGGVLAVGDHDSLGSYMCGRIPREYR